MRRESYERSIVETNPVKRFLVVSNVAGQSFRFVEPAIDGEAAIKQIARRLQVQYPRTSNLYWNFIKKAKYKEISEDAVKR